jgi:hypothetical protein
MQNVIFSLQFSSIYIRDVTFMETPSFFEFFDKYEVAIERIKLLSTVSLPIDIKIDNRNHSINNPVFRLEESTFPGVESVLGSEVNNKKFKLEALNIQKAVDSNGDDLCNYDASGSVIIRKNTFGLLNLDVI